MVWLLVFGGLVLLRVIFVGIGAALLIRPVRDCPACFQPTLPLRQVLLRLLTPYEWRWCPACGWQGPARVIRPRSASPRGRAPDRPPRPDPGPAPP